MHILSVYLSIHHAQKKVHTTDNNRKKKVFKKAIRYINYVAILAHFYKIIRDLIYVFIKKNK